MIALVAYAPHALAVAVALLVVGALAVHLHLAAEALGRRIPPPRHGAHQAVTGHGAMRTDLGMLRVPR